MLILGIGHLLGDFYFQTEEMAKRKEESYQGVLRHSLEYYIVNFVIILPIFSIDMVVAATCAALAHFAIDSIKYVLLRMRKNAKKGSVFAIDQCAHIITILTLAYIMDCRNFSVGHIGIVGDVLHTFGYDAELLASWAFAILFIDRPVNIFMQNFLGGCKPREDRAIIKANHKAGRRIGTMERFIMLVFLAANQYAAIGFILAAKSIARYDKIAKDEQFAEYYLLGTLISTACVVACRMLVFA